MTEQESTLLAAVIARALDYMADRTPAKEQQIAMAIKALDDHQEANAS